VLSLDPMLMGSREALAHGSWRGRARSGGADRRRDGVRLYHRNGARRGLRFRLSTGPGRADFPAFPDSIHEDREPGLAALSGSVRGTARAAGRRW
jgi:hypothetical protein